MKLLAPVLAFIAGLGAGLVLVFANPLVQVGQLEPLALPTLSKGYRAPDTRGFDLGIRPFLGAAQGAGTLEDAANRHVRVSIAVLPAGDNVPAALAVKTSVLSRQNSLWRARLGTLDYWTLYWPGEGSVFVAGYSNYWNLLRDMLWASVRGQGGQGLAPEYPLSALPPRGHATGVYGASGRFSGQPGDARERLLPGRDAEPDWFLDLRLDRARRPAP